MRLKLKRHYPLLIALVLVLILLPLGFGSQRIVAYTVQGSQQITTKGLDYTNSLDVFDGSVVHSIQILMDDETYQSMVTTYKETGEKTYFHANVVIDGVQINNVGIRLKGNASLRTAVGGGPGGFGGPGGNLNGPDGNQPPQPPDQGAQPNRSRANPGNQPQGGMPSGGSRNTQVPMMIKFNEFIAGQRYQGYDRIAVRSAGIAYDASMLQEPVTNSVLRLVGLPATQTAYAGIKRNDGKEELYTISEAIEQEYIDKHFENNDGVLYKAELMANMSYQGDDPSSYARSFTQETQVNNADMAPLIRFLKFVTQASDSEFETGLEKYLDVGAFATYLAVNNLLVNTDSMVGMGNNFYLYYDKVSEQITILMWDANEGLGKHGGGAGSENPAFYDLYTLSPARGGPGMRGGANPLLTRFMASAKFKAIYEEKLRMVYQKAFLSGAITSQIDAFSTVVRRANASRSLVDANAYESAVASVTSFIKQRGEYLAGTSLLSGLANAVP